MAKRPIIEDRVADVSVWGDMPVRGVATEDAVREHEKALAARGAHPLTPQNPELFGTAGPIQEAYREIEHPRDRRGRWRDKPGTVVRKAASLSEVVNLHPLFVSVDDDEIVEVPSTAHFRGDGLHEVSSAIGAIESVHTISEWDDFPVAVLNIAQENEFGSYHSQDFEDKPNRPLYIAVGDEERESTFVHEIGHFLDEQVLGYRRNWGSHDPAGPLKRVMDAIEQTEAIAVLEWLKYTAEQPDAKPITADVDGEIVEWPVEEQVAFAEYRLQAHEKFARAYAQWIALRSKDRKLKEQLDKYKGRGRLGQQWDDEDFRPVARAFDQMAKELGWV